MNDDAGAQLSTVEMDQLLLALNREPGRQVTGDRVAAERCCDLGVLTPAHLAGVAPNEVDSVVYELTSRGQALIDAWAR